MTILEASARLFDWFLKNDTFVFNEICPSVKDTSKDNVKDLLLVSEDTARDRAAIGCALMEFKKSDLVDSFEMGKITYWVLKRPLESYEQTINIDSTLAYTMADFINRFCDLIQDKTDMANPAKLTIKDIKNLYFIALHFAAKDTGKEEVEE